MTHTVGSSLIGLDPNVTAERVDRQLSDERALALAHAESEFRFLMRRIAELPSAGTGEPQRL
jgi:hypothetical protein